MLIHPSSETAPEPVPRQIHPTVCLSDYREHPQGMLLYEGMENRSNIIIDKDCTRIGQGDEGRCSNRQGYNKSFSCSYK